MCRDSRSCTDRSGIYFDLIRQQNLISEKNMRMFESKLAIVGLCLLEFSSVIHTLCTHICVVSVFSVVMS